MNPQFNYTQYAPHITAPQIPLTVGQPLTLQDIFNGGKTSGAELNVDVNPLSQAQKTLEDNLPNFTIGAIGLFMILIGLAAIAAPVAKEIT